MRTICWIRPSRLVGIRRHLTEIRVQPTPVEYQAQVAQNGRELIVQVVGDRGRKAGERALEGARRVRTEARSASRRGELALRGWALLMGKHRVGRCRGVSGPPGGSADAGERPCRCFLGRIGGSLEGQPPDLGSLIG